MENKPSRVSLLSIIFPTETFLGYTAHPWEPSHKDAIGKEGSTKTGYWIKKWANETDRTNYSSTDGGKLDFQNMRYAVVLLNYVEALNEYDPGNPDIEKYLNLIRERGGLGPVQSGLSQELMREQIRLERRIELCFEQLRYFDTRRWLIAEQTGPNSTSSPFRSPKSTATRRSCRTPAGKP